MTKFLDPFNDLDAILEILKKEGVIAYPTEAVFGLGCDPESEHAVAKILSIKKRSPSKGVILIASDFTQLKPYLDLDAVASSQLAEALATWPGPYTWVFPASTLVPSWVRGNFLTIAVRVTEHPIAHRLCQAFNKPLVSTSANKEGELPARTSKQVYESLALLPDAIVQGEVGDLAAPTQIRDILTGKVLRGS